MWWVACLSTYRILSLSWAFNNLTKMCPGVNLFELILLRIHWASLMYKFMSFTNLQSLAIISSNIFSFPFFLSPPSGLPWCVGTLAVVPQMPQALFIFLPSLFFLLHRLNNFTSTSSSSDILCLPIQIFHGNLLVNFSLHLAYFHLQNFYFTPFLSFVPLYWHSLFLHTLFSLVLCLWFLLAKWAYLRQLSSRLWVVIPMSGLPQSWFHKIIFSLWMAHIFLFLYMLCRFLSRIGHVSIMMCWTKLEIRFPPPVLRNGWVLLLEGWSPFCLFQFIGLFQIILKTLYSLLNVVTEVLVPLSLSQPVT